MSFSVVLPGLWVDASDLLDKERLWWCFFCTGTTPRTLRWFRREDVDSVVEVEKGAHPSGKGCVHFLRGVFENLSLLSVLKVLRAGGGYDTPVLMQHVGGELTWTTLSPANASDTRSR